MPYDTTTTANGDFMNAANWTAGVPTAGKSGSVAHNMTITGNQTVTCSILDFVTSTKSLTVVGPANITFNITTSSTINNTSIGLQINPASGVANLTYTCPTLTTVGQASLIASTTSDPFQANTSSATFNFTTLTVDQGTAALIEVATACTMNFTFNGNYSTSAEPLLFLLGDGVTITWNGNITFTGASGGASNGVAVVLGYAPQAGFPKSKLVVNGNFDISGFASNNFTGVILIQNEGILIVNGTLSTNTSGTPFWASVDNTGTVSIRATNPPSAGINNGGAIGPLIAAGNNTGPFSVTRRSDTGQTSMGPFLVTP